MDFKKKKKQVVLQLVIMLTLYHLQKKHQSKRQLDVINNQNGQR